MGRQWELSYRLGMRQRNAHNFPLDLASTESTPVALLAPAIG